MVLPYCEVRRDRRTRPLNMAFTASPFVVVISNACPPFTSAFPTGRGKEYSSGFRMLKSMLKALLCVNRPGVGTLIDDCSMAVKPCCAVALRLVHESSADRKRNIIVSFMLLIFLVLYHYAPGVDAQTSCGEEVVGVVVGADAGAHYVLLPYAGAC